MRQGAATRMLALGLVVVVAAVCFMPGLGSVFLVCSPVLLVLLPLVFGRYPGERQLARLAKAWQARRRRRPARERSRARRPIVHFVPRGGRLIACSLAVRPPPSPVVVR
jgi:hypothetical protein